MKIIKQDRKALKKRIDRLTWSIADLQSSLNLQVAIRDKLIEDGQDTSGTDKRIEALNNRIEAVRLRRLALRVQYIAMPTNGKRLRRYMMNICRKILAILTVVLVGASLFMFSGVSSAQAPDDEGAPVETAVSASEGFLPEPEFLLTVIVSVCAGGGAVWAIYRQLTNNNDVTLKDVSNPLVYEMSRGAMMTALWLAIRTEPTDDEQALLTLATMFGMDGEELLKAVGGNLKTLDDEAPRINSE